MAVVYCTGLGETARRFFYDRVKQYPEKAAVVVLPGRVLMNDAFLAGARAVSFDDLAGELLRANKKILARRGYQTIKKLSRRSQELFIQELLSRYAAADKMQYFQALTQKKGFIKAMAALVGQMGRSGATTEQIRDILLRWHDGDGARRAEKDLEVAYIYVTYREVLKNENLYDVEGLYRLALFVMQRQDAVIPWQYVAFSEFYVFDALQLEFIKALSKRCEVEVGLAYEPDNAVFQAVENTYGQLAAFCELKRMAFNTLKEPPLLHLASVIGKNAPRQEAAGRVRCLEFTSRQGEARWVLAQVKKLICDGCAYQDILVAVRSFANYDGLRQIADEYGVPVSLPLTSPLLAQPLTEFLLLLLGAADKGRAGAEKYFALWESAFGKIIFRTPLQNARGLRAKTYYSLRAQAQKDCAAIAGEGDANLAQINAFLENLPPRAELQTYIELTRDLLAALSIKKLLGTLYKNGVIKLLELKHGLLAEEKIGDVLNVLLNDYQTCQMESRQLAVSEFAEILQEAARDVQLTLAEGRSDGVLATEALNAQGLRFKHVFLLGVREGEFPAARNENWIYDDKERAELAALGLELPSAAAAFAEDAYFFAAAASSADEYLYLSWFKDDSAGQSPYVDTVRRLFSDVSVEASPEKAPASREEVMALGAACGLDWLKRETGVSCRLAKLDEGRGGSYNGQITDPSALRLVAQKTGRAFSASKLEVYAACPFSFLGRQLWRLDQLTEKSETAAAADEGNLLHAALAEFLRGHLNEKLTRYAFSLLEEELTQVFDSVCAAYVNDGAVSDTPLWRAQQGRLRNILRQWLSYEYSTQAKWGGYTPCAVEWDFSAQNGRPLSLRLSDGTNAALLGRVDRIDVSGNALFVTDYKRSQAPAAVKLKNGLDLQLPVYLLAVGTLYAAGRSVAGGGYLTLKKAERKSTVKFADLDGAPFASGRSCTAYDWQEFTASSENFLRVYIESIYRGNFPASPKEKCDPYCPLKDICRRQRQEGDESDA